MSGSELERLRHLLLRPEQQRLDELEGRDQSDAERARNIATLLPSALRQAADNGELGPALAGPLKEGLRQTIRQDAAGLAEVLFPIMGPSIRRAIAEALRDFVNNINGAVAQAVSWQGLRWRMEALRTGRPYGEVVLSHTLSYRVEQALLIHKHSGLVISKAELSSVVANDSDAFSAMLSAIQDFVSDSLKGDSALSTIDMGERTIWIIRGPHAHLACIISGVPQKDLRGHLSNLLDAAHNRYGDLLAEFVGDPAPVAGIDEYTARCLDPLPTASTASPARWPAWALLALLLLAAGAWLLRPATADPPLQIYRALENQPGIAVQNIHQDGGTWVVTLLRDPLGPEPADILQNAGLSSASLRLQTHPYQSLAPTIVLRRARQQMRVPESVGTTLSDTTLVLQGSADSTWVTWLQHTTWPAGISHVNTQALTVARGLRELRNDLPEGVTVEEINGSLLLSGIAPIAWIRELPAWVGHYDVPPLGDTSGLKPREWQQIQNVVADINRQRVYFTDVLEFGVSEQAHLQSIAAQLRDVFTLSSELGLTPTLVLTGYSDGLGTWERNQELRELRATKVREVLTAQGVAGILTSTRVAPDFVPSNTVDLNLRRVDMQLDVGPEPSHWR